MVSMHHHPRGSSDEEKGERIIYRLHFDESVLMNDI